MELKKHMIKRVIFGFLVIVWMITIFCFSNEKSEHSTNTSGTVIKTTLSKFNSFNNLEQQQQEQVIENLQHPIRKIAHFTIYAVGGIIIFNFIDTYDVVKKKKIMFTIIFGALYASIDETHQLFVHGRSGQISDIILDTSGVSIGCLTMCLIYLIRGKLKWKTVKTEN